MQPIKAQPGGWMVVWLLFFFMVINFADKAVIGLAAVPMMKEIGLTPKEFGLVNSSFFFLFSVSAVITGFIVNRIEARWALLAMALVWAVTQFPMLGSVGLGTLIACRMTLGAGEGPAYPVALHGLYKWFPDSLRTLPTAVVSQGASIGVVVAIPLLNYVIEQFTWHWAFAALGIVGLLWAIVWFALGKEGTIGVTVAAETNQQIERVPYSKLLLSGTMLSIFATGFGAYWGLSLLIGWFTPFLIQGLGFTQKEASLITTLPWAANPFVVIAAGWLSQGLVSRGVRTRWARAVFGSGCVVIGGLALVAMPVVPGPALKIAMVVIGMSIPSVIYVMGHAMVSEFTPVSQRGAMLAINNAVATSAGLIGPYVMGSVVQDAVNSGTSVADGYTHGFVICGIVALIGGLLGVIFSKPGDEAARLSRTAYPAVAVAAE